MQPSDAAFVLEIIKCTAQVKRHLSQTNAFSEGDQICELAESSSHFYCLHLVFVVTALIIDYQTVSSLLVNVGNVDFM